MLVLLSKVWPPASFSSITLRASVIGARFVTSKLRERLVRVGLGPGWRFGCGTGEESGSGAVGVVLYC